MRLNTLSLLLVATLLGCNPDNKTPIDKLNDVVIALNENPSFEYIAYYDKKQDGVTLKDTSSVFIEKSIEQGLLPLKYVFESTMGDIQLFDGESFNTIINSERTIIHEENPPTHLIVSNQGLFFSPFYIQSYLKHLLENDKDAIKYLGDTLLGNKKARQYEINTNYIYLLDGKTVRNGDILPNQMKAENINKKHVLTIDAGSNYPLSIKEVYSNNDYIEVSFSDFSNSVKTYRDRAKIIDDSKYLTLSTTDYMQIQISKQKEILGNMAEDFTLPLFPETEISLSELNNSPVLLEFWFPGCGFCIEAIPSVNDIFEKYKSKGLKIFGIEFSDATEEHISNFIVKNKVMFPILMNGKSISLAYGVNSGPTLVLLDKDHKVVYLRNGLDYEELVAQLEKVL